jgi:hypothetical protein
MNKTIKNLTPVQTNMALVVAETMQSIDKHLGPPTAAQGYVLSTDIARALARYLACSAASLIEGREVILEAT